MKFIMKSLKFHSISNVKFAPKLLAFGNALLDHIAKLEDDSILERYNFGSNEHGECNSDKLNEILHYIKQESISFIIHPGGSALNTCRTLCTLGERDSVFFGGIGNDKNGQILLERLNASGVRTCFFVNNDHPTGICVCLIRNDNRTCYADIGASKYINHTFIESKLQDFITADTKQILYIEGFFITGRFALCQYLYNSICRNNSSKLFAINLSGSYIIQENRLEMCWLIEQANIIFGNQGEFETLFNVYGKNTIEQFIQMLYDQKRYPIIVITNGSSAIDVFFYVDGEPIKKHSYAVRPIKKIVDTTGAGDSFVAGFLFSYLNNKSIDDCIECGIEVAGKTIQIFGGSLI